jgi:hypothetical protein
MQIESQLVEVMEVVAKALDVPPRALTQRTGRSNRERRPKVRIGRKMCRALARSHTRCAYAQIGRFFGGCSGSRVEADMADLAEMEATDEDVRQWMALCDAALTRKRMERTVAIAKELGLTGDDLALAVADVRERVEQARARLKGVL